MNPGWWTVGSLFVIAFCLGRIWGVALGIYKELLRLRRAADQIHGQVVTIALMQSPCQGMRR